MILERVPVKVNVPATEHRRIWILGGWDVEYSHEAHSFTIQPRLQTRSKVIVDSEILDMGVSADELN